MSARTHSNFTPGACRVVTLCDRTGSFRIVRDLGEHATAREWAKSKTIVSVPCDRRNVADNDRGLLIANAIESALNAMSAR